MKKSIIIILFAMASTTASAQLNPVKNLSWDHWYVTPNNYFNLSWDEPDPSQDTLMGYNVYRESELYTFSEETQLYHTESASNCGEDFLWYNGGMPFWIHVTAVYNSALEESSYIDSAYCYGFAIGLTDHAEPDSKLHPNPTNGKFHISSRSAIREISVYKTNGELALKSPGVDIIDLGRLRKGLYLVVLKTDDGSFTEKVILR